MAEPNIWDRLDGRLERWFMYRPTLFGLTVVVLLGLAAGISCAVVWRILR